MRLTFALKLDPSFGEKNAATWHFISLTMLISTALLPSDVPLDVAFYFARWWFQLVGKRYQLRF